MSTTHPVEVSGTLCEAFQLTARIEPLSIALRNVGGSNVYTWQQYSDNVRKVAAAYHKLGLRRGDTIAFMMSNRPEFIWLDSAAMHLGAACYSIYNTSSPDQIAHCFTNAGNRIIVAEAQFVPAILASGVAMEHIITIDGRPDGATMTVEELLDHGDPGFDFEAAWRAVQPDDILCLIYTSGTTGPPKGVQLSHDNVMATLRAGREVIKNDFGDRGLSYLPSAHVADRVLGLYSPAAFGIQVTYVNDPKQFAEALPDCRPTGWLAVPRIWEKLKIGIEMKVNEATGIKLKLGKWALAQAAIRGQATLDNRPLTAKEQRKVNLADKLVLSKVREALGLDQLKWCWSGAAPIAPETLQFFSGLGIEICEIWGMSESCGSGTLNPPGQTKIGSVGPALPGTEVRIEPDPDFFEAWGEGAGELLIRGRGVMVGYRNEPEKTAEAIDSEGWLHTGDIGIMDEDGYFTIVDRKKEIIINAAGKNMSPANIENTIKNTTPILSAVAVIGDGRPYNTALVTLDPDAAAMYAEKAGVSADPAELAKDAGLVKMIEDGIAAGNAKLSRVEQIKAFKLMPMFWMPGGDELTPTLKLRRGPIEQKYTAEIEDLYA